jgi:predicted ThiF/HesA family dinucleotide-utilizing enzyme
MSLKQIALNPDIRRLVDDGYEVEIRNGYLLVHSVPYVNSQRNVMLGTIITDLTINADELLPQKDHQVWFCGEYPCHSNGSPIEAIRHTSETRLIVDDVMVNHRFSNKPFGTSGYPNYYSKMTAYIEIISNEAKAIADLDARTFKAIPPIEEDRIFMYDDSASSRADILAISMKLAMSKVTIIGLGGTGAYVLDLVAKTPVKQIQLFDGDQFLQHNAFRAPGAASKEVLAQKMPKVEYYTSIYAPMRKGIIPNNEYVTEENLSKLDDCEFVFICVDNGLARKLISEYLISKNIPFIDVGMELSINTESSNLIGTCRVTIATPEKSDHCAKHMPMMDDETEDLYRKNIQVADINCLNAALAVMKWKQYCNFYQDIFKAHNTTYSVNSHSLTRDEMNGLKEE